MWEDLSNVLSWFGIHVRCRFCRIDSISLWLCPILESHGETWKCENKRVHPLRATPQCACPACFEGDGFNDCLWSVLCLKVFLKSLYSSMAVWSQSTWMTLWRSFRTSSVRISHNHTGQTQCRVTVIMDEFMHSFFERLKIMWNMDAVTKNGKQKTLFIFCCLD